MLLGESKQVLSESFPRKFEASARSPQQVRWRWVPPSKVVVTAGPTLLLLSSVVLISLHQTLKWDWANPFRFRFLYVGLPPVCK